MDSFIKTGPHYPDPLGQLYEIQDQDAFKGERRSARNLEDLVSPSGMPYHEITDKPRREHPRTARTDFNLLAGSPHGHTHYSEFAFFCEHEGLWIQGAPSAAPYDNLGPLSGSAGWNLSCRICGRDIGRLVEKRS